MKKTGEGSKNAHRVKYGLGGMTYAYSKIMNHTTYCLGSKPGVNLPFGVNFIYLGSKLAEL